MSTFFFCILDFITASPMSVFLVVPVPIYACCLFWRALSFKGKE